MDIIEEKIKELLAEAKILLKNKQVSETVEKMKLVLQLDPENEEAKYVLDKLNIATGIQIVTQRKLLIITEDKELISNIKVLFNGIEIGQLNNGFFEFPLKNDGIIELKHEYFNINISAHKNQSSVVIVKNDKEKDQLLYDQFDFDNLESLLELSKKFIAQQKYHIASGVLEQILIFDSANSHAYFQRLLIELEFKTPNQLNDSKVLLDDNENYNKALRHANNQFRLELLSYANIARENLYNNAISDVENRKYEDAISKFKTIKKYKDSETQIENLEKIINEIEIERRYVKAITYFKEGLLSNSFDLFESLNSYKDTSEYIEKIKDLQNTEAKYQSGIISQPYPRIDQIESSIQILQSLGDYKDSRSLVLEYKTLLQKSIEKQNNIEQKRAKTKKTIKLGVWIGAPVILLVIVFLIINSTVLVPTNKYNDAMTLIDSGNYAEAKAILTDLEGFSDSENQITIVDAYIAFESQSYEEGITLLEGIGIPVNIRYDLDGGDSSTLNYSLFVPLSLSDDTPNKAGYTFNGWELIDYSINNIKGEYSAEVDLKATYLLSQYTIAFVLNGGEGVSNSTYNMNSTTILLPNPTRVGYTFRGWYDNPDFNEESITEIVSGSSGDITLYALWTINEYTISFNSNGGSSVTNITQNFNTTVPEPTEPTKLNYVFGGWYKNATLTETFVFNTMPAEDVTLYAKWIYKYYTITYDPDGGNLSALSQQVEYDKTYNLSLPTRENYVFLGWYSNNVLFENGTWTRTSDISLVARWDSIYEYSVSDNEVTITGFNYAVEGTTVVFPEEIFGYPVVQIGEVPTSIYSYSSKPIGIPSNIISIVVPNCVQTIGRGAFNGASSLQSITIPFVGESRSGENGYFNLGYIFGSEEFYNSYEARTWDGDLYEAGYYYLPNSLTSIIITDTTILGAYAFQYIRNITSLVLPNNLVSIGYMSFDSCNIIGSIIIPLSVTSISNYAFDVSSTIANFTIYVRATSKPSGWNDGWVDSEERVVWGYTGN